MNNLSYVLLSICLAVAALAEDSKITPIEASKVSRQKSVPKDDERQQLAPLELWEKDASVGADDEEEDALPSNDAEVDGESDDGVDKRARFAFAKRARFAFAKRPHFAFAKRASSKFAFAKRPSFAFAKRARFAFAKRPSFAFAKRGGARLSKASEEV